MAKAIQNFGTTNVAINVDSYATDELVSQTLKRKDYDSAGNGAIAILRTDVTDEHPVSFTFRNNWHLDNVKYPGVGKSIGSITVNATELETDAEGIETARPVEIKLTITTPGQSVGDTDGLMSLLGNLFSLMAGTITAQEPDGAGVEALQACVLSLITS